MSVLTKLLSITLINLTINCTYANINTNNSLLITYDQLVKAVESGDDIKAIIHLDRCQITDSALQSKLAPSLINASTRFNFTKYLHYNVKFDGEYRDTVTTSMSSLVEQPIPGLFWTLFARLNVYDDNTAILHVDYFDSLLHKSYLVVEWLCDISDGKDTRGLLLIDSL